MINRKGAIELSANFIVIMVISIVILGAGILLVNKIVGAAQDAVRNTNSRTEAQLRSMMLNNNYNVAIYPTDINIKNGKSEFVDLAITNNLMNEQKFYWLSNYKAEYFETSESPAELLRDVPLDPKRPKISINTVGGGFSYLGIIKPKDMIFKGIKIDIPKVSKAGQYVLTFQIWNMTTTPANAVLNTNCASCKPYGIVKVYVTVP